MGAEKDEKDDSNEEEDEEEDERKDNRQFQTKFTVSTRLTEEAIKQKLETFGTVSIEEVQEGGNPSGKRRRNNKGKGKEAKDIVFFQKIKDSLIDNNILKKKASVGTEEDTEQHWMKNLKNFDVVNNWNEKIPAEKSIILSKIFENLIQDEPDLQTDAKKQKHLHDILLKILGPDLKKNWYTGAPNCDAIEQIIGNLSYLGQDIESQCKDAGHQSRASRQIEMDKDEGA